ncbi:hypothetical protein ASPBRDRAFT_414518 [Aspergillus brasiliensis CBS 101740]|uniref:Uncharacterized protein n=1 Tax=Aspergillus brasiliensis (strain CBS 101740 / IMI 381727 / IBT 21946) TaxID=767769 RepID=A0A1L9UY54_ASPBC|nr:hypothetical protein ASPBRDRAFT_414518 [Aspergillus brasiliensis CBS 101740]
MYWHTCRLLLSTTYRLNRLLLFPFHALLLTKTIDMVALCLVDSFLHLLSEVVFYLHFIIYRLLLLYSDPRPNILGINTILGSTTHGLQQLTTSLSLL